MDNLTEKDDVDEFVNEYAVEKRYSDNKKMVIKFAELNKRIDDMRQSASDLLEFNNLARDYRNFKAIKLFYDIDVFEIELDEYSTKYANYLEQKEIIVVEVINDFIICSKEKIIELRRLFKNYVHIYMKEKERENNQ